MERLRQISGLSALILVALSLNVLVLTEDLFSLGVMAPLMLSAVAGVTWLGSVLVGRADKEKGEGALYRLNAVVGSVVFLAICVTLYAFVKRLDQSWDLTQEGRRELSPQTVLVLQGLKEDVEITCFFVNSGDERVDTAQDKARRFLERCQDVTHHVKVEYVDPQRHPERVQALKALRLQISGVGSVVMRSGTRSREIPLSDVMARLDEREFLNAMINVSRESRPKVYFLTGHGERDIENTGTETGGSDFMHWLLKEGYEVAKHYVDGNAPKIPEDADLLIINGYGAGFTFFDIEAFDEYVNRGGRMLILSDPAFVARGPIKVIEHLRPWLSTRLGVELGGDAIISRATKGLQLALVSDFSLLGDLAAPTDDKAGFRGSFNSQHPITRGINMQMSFVVARSVTLREEPLEGWSGTSLLRTTSDSWAETDLEAIKTGGASGNPIQPDPGELDGAISVAVAVTLQTDTPMGDGSRMRHSRVVVVGDADVASNGETGIDVAANSNFLLNTVAWLTENDELIAIRATGHEDQPIILTEMDKRVVALFTSLGPVQAVAALGLFVLWRRRKFR